MTKIMTEKSQNGNSSSGGSTGPRKPSAKALARAAAKPNAKAAQTRRKCAAQGCEVMFSPKCSYQRYHDSTCRNRESQRFLRERARMGIRESAGRGRGQ
jgi:hypothetical protein